MKNIILKSCLIALCLICGLGNAWGEDITFDATSKKTSLNGVTLSVTDGTLTNGTDYRVYKNQTLTITSTVGNITNIAFTYSSASYDGGGWAASYQPNAATWTSPVANGEQARITKIVVTLSGQLLTHTAHFSINGTINDAYDCTVTEGSAITFPTGLADINGKKFVGWMEGTISGTADTAPDFVTSATMGTADITYNAVYATQGEGGGSTTATYGFEDTDDATLWNIDGPNESTAYHNSGSKSGFINTNHTYITFNEKVNATNFSFAFTRTSTNNNYNVYIETSTDGTKWTAVKTYAMSSFASNGTFQTISHDFDGSEALYVRFHCYNTTASRYVDDVSITYNGGTTYSGYCTTVPTSGPTDASWAVTPEAVSVEVGKTATATISTNYDGTLIVSSNATGTATATISDKTITVTGVAAGTTTLTVTGAATSNFNAISKTIDVTVTASSATTPAFAYFEETATINVGEILEAKDYCGTIAPDAGFDEYSISTAVCSAIGAADGQKISDDYACIYSKVSFKKAGTYVVHVTAPAVAGKYTASEGYITVTVTGPTLYKVTIETPANGTLIVKHGDDTVNSGDEFEEGEKLQITATPDADYKFRNWQAYDGTTHTFTTSFEWEMSAHDVTLTANFDEIQDYTIAWSVNGKIVKSETLEEGTEVVPVQPTDDLFTAAVPAGVTKVFTGWVTTPTVDADSEPEYVTPSNATANVTYYAVFAKKTGSGSGTGGDYVLVESDLGTAWAGDYLIVYSDDVFADGRVGGTDGLGKAQSHVDPNDALSLDKKTVTSAWGDTYHVTLEEIAENSNTYVLKTQDGKYSYQTLNKNGLAVTENKNTAAAYPITVTFNSNANISLALGGSAAGAVFHYNNNVGSTGEMFRFYKDGGQQPIYLYKKSATTGGTTYSDFTTLPYLQLDEANTSIVELADAPCDKVEVTRALKAGNWNTFCLPFSLNEEEIESQLGSDAEVKALSTFDVNAEGTTLILNFGDASEIVAGQPYMVRVQEAVSTITAEGKTINTVTAPVQEFSNDLYNCNFHGNYYYLEGTKNGYVPHSTFIISNNLFYLVNSNVKMKGFRGYIEATEKATGAPVKAMSFTTDAVVTGTIGIQYEGLEDGCIYNLQGLRQSKLQKGINIVNGKKVLR